MSTQLALQQKNTIRFELRKFWHASAPPANYYGARIKKQNKQFIRMFERFWLKQIIHTQKGFNVVHDLKVYQ